MQDLSDIRIGSKVKLTIDDFYLRGKIGEIYALPIYGTGCQVMVEGVKVTVSYVELELIEY